MPYKYFKEWDTGGDPIYEWGCGCEECRTTTGPCMALIEMIEEERKSIFTGIKCAVVD